jgi:hypothetical protein
MANLENLEGGSVFPHVEIFFFALLCWRYYDSSLGFKA